MTYEAILSENRLEDVVQSYYRMKRTGSLYRSTCPFCENEDLEGIKKSELESFFVNPRTQTWTCLLCWHAGSAVDFIRMIEPCSFKEAFKLLENRIKIRRKENGI